MRNRQPLFNVDLSSADFALALRQLGDMIEDAHRVFCRELRRFNDSDPNRNWVPLSRPWVTRGEIRNRVASANIGFRYLDAIEEGAQEYKPVEVESIPCPNCQSETKALGNNRFCLDCDWDDLKELTP